MSTYTNYLYLQNLRLNTVLAVYKHNTKILEELINEIANKLLLNDSEPELLSKILETLSTNIIK